MSNYPIIILHLQFKSNDSFHDSVFVKFYYYNDYLWKTKPHGSVRELLENLNECNWLLDYLSK